MKLTLLTLGLLAPLYLTACDVRKSESTKVEPSPKEVSAEKVEIEEVPAAGEISEEAPSETEDEVTGAVIGGAAVGGILGHQSGSALEGAAIGAAIGAAAGGIEYQPDEVEEE